MSLYKRLQAAKKQSQNGEDTEIGQQEEVLLDDNLALKGQEIVDTLRQSIVRHESVSAKRRSMAQVRAKMRGRALFGEALLVVLLLGIATVVRVIGLDSIEPNVMPDEADNAVILYRILSGNGPGLLGLSWDGQPALNMYFMALCMRLFGMTVIGLRMGVVIVGIVSVLVLYLLARQRLSIWASWLAALLMATNLWYLNFSRNAWINIFASLYMLIAIYALTLALRRERWWLYYALAGIAAALGLYSYFSGRFVIVVLLCCLPFVLLMHREQWRRIMLGYGIIVALCVALFLPSVPILQEHWDTYTARAEATYIFAPDRNGGLDLAEKAAVIGKQIEVNARGFLFLDGSVMRGFRYTVPGQPLLDRLTATLFLAGLALGLWRWRRTVFWLVPGIVSVAGTQLLSANTPDPARALAAAPFYFLFVGFLFDRLPWKRTWYGGMLQIAALVLAIAIACTNVIGYVQWMGSPTTAQVRQPAVENEEFFVWQQRQLDLARQGRPAFNVGQWHEMRKELIAPPPVQPAPEANPAADSTTQQPAAPDDSPDGSIEVTPKTSEQEAGSPMVELVFGERGKGEEQFNEPRDVAVENSGRIYVADTANHRIVAFNSEGSFLRMWGQDGSGDGPYDLVEPLAVAVNSQRDVIVLDSATGWLKKYDREGRFVARWGGPGAGMYHPRDMILDAQGNSLVADTGGCRILKFSPTGERLGTLGPVITGTASLLEPVGLALDDYGNLYIADVGNRRVVKFNSSWQFVTEWPIPEAVAYNGHHLAVTTRQTLVVTDPAHDRLLEFNLHGGLLGTWGGAGNASGQFDTPVGIGVAGDGMYVADTMNHRLQRLRLEPELKS